MPTYRTIIDHLAELSPESSARIATAAALKMLPPAENSSDPLILKANVDADARAWATRLAFDSLRGWHWPYWLNAQTNPASGISTISLHQPLLFNECARDLRPVVHKKAGRLAGTLDARGMFTPPGQNFSVEVWFRVGEDVVFPSCIFDPSMVQFSEDSGGISFRLTGAGCQLHLTTTPKSMDGFDFVSLRIELIHPTAKEQSTSRLPVAVYVAFRPYTIDGIVPIHDLVYNSKGFWMSDNRIIALFPRRPDISWGSDAFHGDAGMFLFSPPERTAVRCPAGMATAVSAFHISNQAAVPSTIECVLPLAPVYPREVPFHLFVASESESKRRSTIQVQTPKDGLSAATGASPLFTSNLDHLMAATDVAAPAIQEMLLQRNHWIVAAVRALHTCGQQHLVTRLLNYCALGLGRNGYLPKSHGRWGFAGQFLTALADHYRLGEKQADTQILRYTQIKSIGRWIVRKRREVSYAPRKPAGLFPPGLTRDGIGREYQLVDNIWGIEGLVAASWLARQFGEHSHADAFHAEAVNFAAQVNAAIHRELEYGIMQKVPGRLHRAFDPASASELLDIALTHEARGLLSPVEGWLSQVISELSQPLANAPEAGDNAELLRIDERGVSPARRLMLALLQMELDSGNTTKITEFEKFTTASGVWPEYLDITTQTGRGALHFDPEAAALYLILTRKLKVAANNRGS